MHVFVHSLRSDPGTNFIGGPDGNAEMIAQIENFSLFLIFEWLPTMTEGQGQRNS